MSCSLVPWKSLYIKLVLLTFSVVSTVLWYSVLFTKKMQKCYTWFSCFLFIFSLFIFDSGLMCVVNHFLGEMEERFIRPRRHTKVMRMIMMIPIIMMIMVVIIPCFFISLPIYMFSLTSYIFGLTSYSQFCLSILYFLGVLLHLLKKGPNF